MGLTMSSHNALVVTLILTISLMAQSLPERDADAWNEIGEEIGEEIGKVLVCKETDQGCQNLAAQACPADYKLQNNANTKVDGKFLDNIVTIKYEGKNYVLCKNASYDANGNPIFCQSGMWGTKSIKIKMNPVERRWGITNTEGKWSDFSDNQPTCTYHTKKGDIKSRVYDTTLVESNSDISTHVIYYGACYYSSKETKEQICKQGAGCWGSQDKLVWGKGACPSKTTPIDWDAAAHRPCGKKCTAPTTLVESNSDISTHVIYYGACYYSSKETKEQICKQGAGCWGSQDKLVWGK